MGGLYVYAPHFGQLIKYFSAITKCYAETHLVRFNGKSLERDLLSTAHLNEKSRKG